MDDTCGRARPARIFNMLSKPCFAEHALKLFKKRSFAVNEQMKIGMYLKTTYSHLPKSLT
jgi:hypothetical protein